MNGKQMGGMMIYQLGLATSIVAMITPIFLFFVLFIIVAGFLCYQGIKLAASGTPKPMKKKKVKKK